MRQLTIFLFFVATIFTVNELHSSWNPLNWGEGAQEEKPSETSDQQENRYERRERNSADVAKYQFPKARVKRAPSTAMNLVVNGDFETGDFTGWTTDSVGSGSWVINPPDSPSVPICPPPQGTFQAVTIQGNRSSNTLYQNITIPPGEWELSFTYCYNNDNIVGGGNSEFFNPGDLDPFGSANQQIRVDIMAPSPANPFSLDPMDILATPFQIPTGVPPSSAIAPTIAGPVLFGPFDMTPFAGQTIRLRFAEADNQLFLAFAIDDVRIEPKAPVSDSAPETVIFLLEQP